MHYIAKQFQPHPDMEVLGATLITLNHNLREDITDPIFAKYNLDADHLQPDEWYPAVVLSDVQKEIHAKGRGSSALVAMGKALAIENLTQGKVNSIEDFIAGFKNVQQHEVLRNYPEGYGWSTEKVGEQRYRVTNNTDAPNDIVYGYLWETLRQLISEHEHFQVLPIKNFGPDAEDGAVYEISWGED